MKDVISKLILGRYEYKILYKRIWFTSFILMIFILGTRIPIVSSGVKQASEFHRITSAGFGGNIDSLNIFTIGLGPWLTAMIIINLLQYRNSEKYLLQTKQDRQLRERALTLLLSVIQSFYTVNFLLEQQKEMSVYLIILILVTGSMMLIWFSDLNSENGIAGPMPIVFVSIIGSIFRRDFTDIHLQWNTVIIIIFVVLMILIVLVFIERSEYKINYLDLMSLPSSRQKSYISWKLNPAGSLSIMIGLSLFMMIRYLYQLILKLLDIKQGYDIIDFSTPEGITLFVVLLFVLNFFMSKLILNPVQTAREFLKSGNYIEGVRPGKETEYFLIRKADIICFVGTVIVTAIIGIPLYMTLLIPSFAQEILITVQLIMLVYIALNIVETIRAYRYFDRYSSILKNYW